MYLSIFLAIAFVIGFFTILDINPIKGMQRLPSIFKRRLSFKDMTLKALGREKNNFIERQFLQAKRVLQMTGRSAEYDYYKRFSALLAVVGAGLGLVLLNPFLAVVLAVTGLLIPVFVVQLSVIGYNRESREELYAGISIVTSSYERTGDIMVAVEENIGHLSSSIAPVFKEMQRHYNLIDPDLHKAVQHVRPLLDHPIWHKWCDNLQMCIDDPSKRYILRGVVKDCGSQNSLQNELDTLLNRPMAEAIGVSVIVFANVPILSLLSSDFAKTIFQTLQGKLALGGIAAGILFMFYRAVRAMRPLTAEVKTV